MFGVASGGEFYAMAPAETLEGFALMDAPMRPARSRSWRRRTTSSIARASALTLDVPPALTDLSLTDFPRGDLDRDPAVWDEAGVKATRGAAVLVPVVDHPEPGVLLTMRTSDLPSHAGQIAFPGGKIDPGDATPLAAALARGRRGDRARRRADRADRLSRSLSDLHGLSHPAGGGARHPELRAAHQRVAKSPTPSRCRSRS